jgi:hypothetical protein
MGNIVTDVVMGEQTEVDPRQLVQIQSGVGHACQEQAPVTGDTVYGDTASAPI